MKFLFRILFFLIFSSSAFSQELVDLTQTPNMSVPEVLENFSKIENYYSVHHDRRKLFVKIYSYITNGIEDMISTREVSHGPWLEDLIVGFSEEYRKSVLAYESNNQGQLPLPWRYDFNQAKIGKIGPATQLLLSLNSHILHDLPLTISKSVNSSADLGEYKFDYFKLNKMFKKLIPNLFVILYREQHFSNPLSNRPSEIIKKRVVNQLVMLMRKTAWNRALILSDVQDQKAKDLYMKNIGIQTEHLSMLVASLDPFLSTAPGQLFPDHLRKSTWLTLKKIHQLLDSDSSPNNWEQVYNQELIKFNNSIN